MSESHAIATTASRARATVLAIAALAPLGLIAFLPWNRQPLALLAVAITSVLVGHLLGLRALLARADRIEAAPGQLALAPLLLMIAVTSACLEGYAGVMLAAYAWGLWHAVTSSRDFVSRLSSSLPPPLVALEAVVYVGCFVAAPLASQHRLGGLLDLAYDSGAGIPSARSLEVLRVPWIASTMVVTVSYVVVLCIQWRQHRQPFAGRLVAAATSIGSWWLATFLFPDMLVSVFMWALFHELRRTSAPFHRSPALVGTGLGLVVALVSCGFLASDAPSRRLAHILQSLLATVALVHFYYRGCAWKPPAQTLEARGSPGYALRWAMVVLLAVGLASAVQMRRQRTHSPVARYKALVAALPGYVDGHYWLALAYDAEKHLYKALTSARRALELRPGYPRFAALALLLEARLAPPGAQLEMFEAVVALDPGNGAAVYSLAVHKGSAGDTDEALRLFYRALALEPSLVEPHVQIAVIEAKRSRLGNSVDHMQKAVTLRPEDPALHAFLGYLFFQRGDHEEALRQYAAALSFDETDHLSRQNAGMLLVRLSRTMEAIEHFRWAVEHDPSLFRAQRGLATALRRLSRFAELLDHLRYAHEHHPTNVEFMFELGEILSGWPTEGLGDAEEALQVVGRLQAIRGDRPRILDLMGRALAQAGRTEEAVDYARRAAELYRQRNEMLLADQASKRQRLYAAGEPYRSPNSR